LTAGPRFGTVSTQVQDFEKGRIYAGPTGAFYTLMVSAQAIDANGGHDVRKPALDLSDVVRQTCTLITEHRSECISGTVAGFAWPRRAVKPNAA
jgi:hypothetical protein